jgi:hypothetical protein
MDQMLECPLTEMKTRQEDRRDAIEASQEKIEGNQCPMREQ